MVNAILRKKEPFPKNVSEACQLLASWHNNYGGQSVQNEANDGVTFTTVCNDKDKPNRGSKKKEIHLF